MFKNFNAFFILGNAIGYFGWDYLKKYLGLFTGGFAGDRNSDRNDDSVELDSSKDDDCNQYIEYQETASKVKIGNTNYVVKDSSRSQSNVRESPDSSGQDADREYLPELVYSKEYDTKDDAAKEIEDGVLLVTDDEAIIGDYDIYGISNEEGTKEIITSVSSVAFVKAIAAGSEVCSFIFNPLEKRFYWNLIDKPLTYEESCKYIGKGNVEEILEESGVNANGWVQTRYFRNESSKVYIKVETAMIGI